MSLTNLGSYFETKKGWSLLLITRVSSTMTLAYCHQLIPIVTRGITWDGISFIYSTNMYCVPDTVLGVGMWWWVWEGESTNAWSSQSGGSPERLLLALENPGTQRAIPPGGTGDHSGRQWPWSVMICFLLVVKLWASLKAHFFLEEIQARTGHRNKAREERGPSLAGVPGPMKTFPDGRYPLAGGRIPCLILI